MTSAEVLRPEAVAATVEDEALEGGVVIPGFRLPPAGLLEGPEATGPA